MFRRQHGTRTSTLKRLFVHVNKQQNIELHSEMSQTES